MTIDNKIRDNKLLFHVNTKATKISLISSKADKYEYLTGEEILPCSQSRIIDQTKIQKKVKKNLSQI